MLTVLNRIYAAGAVLAASCMVSIALLTLAQIAGRLLGVLIVDAGEFAGFAMAGSIFLALAHTLRTGGHIRVNLLITRIRGPVRRLVEMWCLLFAIVLCGMFAIFSVRMVIDSYAFGDISIVMMPIPLWIPQSTMAAGAIVFLIALIHELVLVMREGQAGYMSEENSKEFTE